ncbi:MAG: tetratricopeptide repeat protein [Spirochaetales bacterium]|nr:tetratricopeptide repeat protein [Spirochaetales bacterium]
MLEGKKLYKQGKYREALEFFRKQKSDEDTFAEISYYLGLCYAKLEKLEEALLYLEQVVTSDLGFAQAYQARMLLAYIYCETDRFRLAEFELEKLSEDGYDSVQVHSALGFVLHAQGKKAAAIHQLEKALEIDERNPTALNSLAYIMAEENIRPGVALTYVRRALEQRPDHPAYLDTLGWVQFRIGNLTESLETLRRARKKWPDNNDIRSHLRVVMDKNHEAQQQKR